MSYATVPPPASEEQQIAGRNAVLDFMERSAKKNRWRFLCWALPHVWNFTHLFDDAPDEFNRWRGVGNYAGICLRCGKRDLFRGAPIAPAQLATRVSDHD